MNAVEIEEAVSELAAQSFEPEEFAFQFLTAFGMKDTTVKRLRTGASNSSDVPGGVLQRSNIHIATSPAGRVGETLGRLRESPKTAAAKARFILATDGETIEAEDLTTGEAVACEYADLSQHFGFFLPLAGISTVTEIKNNPIDIKATGRLNKLYVELLKDNPDWGTKEKRPALNQFMARLIFCFFAEDTGIFLGEGLFTSTIARMSTPGHGSGEERWGNTHEVLAELFRAMATDTRHNGQLDGRHRKAAGIKSWADVFPYVNGGLFSGSVECPKFSRIARSYLLRAGELSWKEINPDIFGSMIQAVADDDERGELGMHYTSVPNILKVLSPLFLDDLREQLEAADENIRKLRNLRKRIAGIRVFDPACGSGNFLVIAYLKMREIEHEIVQRTGDDPRSLIELTNFYGIEIKSFAVEIARLSLLIAEFQADCRYISQHEARAMVLPLHRTGQVHVGNALRINWLEVCPPTRRPDGREHDLGGPTGRLALEDSPLAEDLSAETFLCGNPPYLGSSWQSKEQKEDIRIVAEHHSSLWRSLDYVAGWFIKSAEYLQHSGGGAGLVATSSIGQGEQVAALWPSIFKLGVKINFAHRPFKWANLAANSAGVTVAVIGLARTTASAVLYDGEEARRVDNISPYLVPANDIVIGRRQEHLSLPARMLRGNMPTDGGNFIMSVDEMRAHIESGTIPEDLLKLFWGADEVIQGVPRACLWVPDDQVDRARSYVAASKRLDAVRASRLSSSAPTTRARADLCHRFMQIEGTAKRNSIAIPAVTSENRPYLPAAILDHRSILSNRCYALYDADLYYFALIVSKMHLVWVATVCGRLESRFSYSNTIGWNNFPVPRLTEQNKADLARSAENILLARESHFPASIADLYEPESMPEDLRRAHEANDEVVERIYIGRIFRNDTERLEKLFELYTKMTADQPNKKAKRAA